MLFVISVGGSLIYPPSGLDLKFLISFKNLLEAQVDLGNRFLLVTGGGYGARKYISAGKKLGVDKDSQDWLGIKATHHNALLLKSCLGSKAYGKIIDNPEKKINFQQKIALAGGWRPGRSTDYVAVRLAKTYGAKVVLNLSNIDYVYDKDPKLAGAKPIDKMSWKDFRKIVGNEWRPGFNSPFDPVASRLAQANDLTVIVINGQKMTNVKKCLLGEKFKGTVIEK